MQGAHEDVLADKDVGPDGSAKLLAGHHLAVLGGEDDEDLHHLRLKADESSIMLDGVDARLNCPFAYSKVALQFQPSGGFYTAVARDGGVSWNVQNTERYALAVHRKNLGERSRNLPRLKW
jgi:hypothetical protein